MSKILYSGRNFNKIHNTQDLQVWLMAPNQKFHILQWNAEGQYLLARNDADNQSAGNLYSRIDYLAFDQDMEPYQWGFCYSPFEAKSVADARQAAVADRENPKPDATDIRFPG